MRPGPPAEARAYGGRVLVSGSAIAVRTGDSCMVRAYRGRAGRRRDGEGRVALMRGQGEVHGVEQPLIRVAVEYRDLTGGIRCGRAASLKYRWLQTLTFQGDQPITRHAFGLPREYSLRYP
jgi:hypothetical protein